MSIGILPATADSGPLRLSIAQSKNSTSPPHTTFEIFGIESYPIDDAASKTRTFKCVASAPLGFTVEVRLTDLTAGGAVLCTVSTANTTPTSLSATFSSADATARQYSVEVRVTGGVPGVADKGFCYGSYIEVQ